MLTVAAGIVERGGEILICQRRAGGTHPGRWEFPGGKVEAGEEPDQALERELFEELGIRAEIGPEVMRYEHAYTGKNPILLVFFRVTQWKGEMENRVFAQMLWAERGRLLDFDFLEGDLVLIQFLGKFHVDQVE